MRAGKGKVVQIGHTPGAVSGDESATSHSSNEGKTQRRMIRESENLACIVFTLPSSRNGNKECAMKKFACLLILPLLVSVAVAKDFPVFFGEQVVVSATKFPQFRSKVLENVSVISSRDIETSGADTVAEALRNLSGVYVKGNGGLGGVSTIKLRSAYAEQTLVLVDGVRLNSALLGMADVGDILTGNIDRIEIIAFCSRSWVLYS